MRRLPVFALLLLFPLAVFAGQPCRFQAPRTLSADLAGVHSVRIEVHSQNVHVLGSATATGLTGAGRACASSRTMLDALQVTARRKGDQLVVDVGGDAGGFHLSWFDSFYAYLDLNLQLPASMPVTLDVGSGDATAAGLQQLAAQVGSGDLHVRQIAGKFSASVGSGDIDANDVGSLALDAVGSGDFKAAGVRGDAQVGSIGSGDVGLRIVVGSVQVDTLGSGDLTVRDVQGGFSLRSRGSGDVDYSGVKGQVNVPRGDD